MTRQHKNVRFTCWVGMLFHHEGYIQLLCVFHLELLYAFSHVSFSFLPLFFSPWPPRPI